MTHPLHIYAFGSICRGEISPGSDVDLLAVSTGGANNLSRSMFSIYSHRKIIRIWQDGNPFAWHLHLEAKLLSASDDRDFLRTLGSPAVYGKSRDDCERFLAIFQHAQDSALRDSTSIVFDLSSAFLGLRNFCSCFLLGRERPDFSRNVALNLMGADPPVSMDVYLILERARLLCTRAYGAALTKCDIELARTALPTLNTWMTHVHEGKLDG